MVEIGVVFQGVGLHRLGELREARMIVVAITFHTLNAQCSTHSQILKQGNRAHIAEVFPAHDNGFALVGALSNQAAVGDALKNTLTILVAGAGITQTQGCA